MAKVILTAAARDDLKEIKTYISSVLMNPGAANGILKVITHQLHLLGQFPEMGALLMAKSSPIVYRYLVCGRYMAFYRIQKSTVHVDRILYGRRDYLSILFGNELFEETETQ